MIFSLITFDPSTVVSEIGSTSAPVFSDLLPIAVFVIGIIVALGVVGYIIAAIAGAFRR